MSVITEIPDNTRDIISKEMIGWAQDLSPIRQSLSGEGAKL